jgi:hypothetical protein
MSKMQKFLWFLGLLVACSPGTPSDERAQDPKPPQLVAARVTGTVKREAAWLVQIQTEHGVLLTTPEHPFATPQSGWIPAGRLARGDRVVSTRFGTVRVSSAQKQKPARPRFVFNLTVDPSHAYVVGTDHVLVHNGKCKDVEKRDKEIEEAERELRDLTQRLASSAEDKAALQQRITAVKSTIAKLKKQARSARFYQRKRKTEDAAEPDPEVSAIDQTTQAIEALDREIEASQATTAGSAQLLAELKSQRAKLMERRRRQRSTDKRQRGIAPVPLRERLLKDAEADYESRRQELEAALRELSELTHDEPQSDVETSAHAARRAALEQKIQGLQLEHDVSKAILAGERTIAELARRSPSTDVERQKIAEEQRYLKDMVSKKRHEQRVRDNHRKRREDPDVRERSLRFDRESRRRRLRPADYVADTERPRDTLELLEEELAERRQADGSGSLDDATEHLAERIATLHALVEFRREKHRFQRALHHARARRRELIRAGGDTREIEQKIARLEQQRTARRTPYVQLLLREKLLAKLDGTTRTDAPGAMDEARLRELERELEHELAAGGAVPEERLQEIERELGESELIDAEFLEAIWREAEAEEAAIQESVQGEAEDVDALLQALAESTTKSPSPERTATPQSGLQALRNELWEERRSVEAADFDLANVQASLSQTLAPSGSRHHAAGAQRLAEVQQQRLQLRIDWRERMQHRLDAARRELRTMQSIERFRDQTAESELVRKIALLEHEVNNPLF